MIIHRHVVVHQLGRHFGDVVVALGRDRLDPVGGSGWPVSAHAIEQRRDAGADIADHGRDDLDVAIHFLRLDVDLDELLRRIAPGLALAVRQQPIQPRADQQHDIGVLQNGRARGAGALRMGVGQQSFRHTHRQERRAGLFDESTHGVVSLRVGRAFAENDQRLLGAFQHLKRALDRIRRRNLRRRGVDDFHQRLLAGVGIHDLAEQFGRQVEIDAAGTARYRRADGAGNADADIGGVQHAECRLAQRLGDGELVHFLVIALLEIDDLALGRTGNQDHREAVGGGVRQSGQAVEEAGRRHGEADAGLLGQEAGDRGGVAGVLLVTERQHANAGGLRHAAEIRDRNAGHAIDRVQAVELERVDDEIEAVGEILFGFG